MSKKSDVRPKWPLRVVKAMTGLSEQTNGPAVYVVMGRR